LNNSDFSLIIRYALADPGVLENLREEAIRYAWAYAYVTSCRKGYAEPEGQRIADRVRRNVRKAFRFPLPRDNQKEVDHAE